MNDAPRDVSPEAGISTMPDTQHEPHEHAPRRVIIGITAAVLVFVLGGFIWFRWGDTIERACFGDSADACTLYPIDSR